MKHWKDHGKEFADNDAFDAEAFRHAGRNILMNLQLCYQNGHVGFVE